MKKSIYWINLILLVAMLLHVGISMYVHSQDITNSAPAYVCLLNGLYYLIPMGVLNLVVLCVNKFKAK